MRARSAERVVSISPRIVGKRRLGVQLNALQSREEEHCLHEIHLDLAETRGRRELDRDLIRSPLAIEFNPASQYMIRAFRTNVGTDNELAVHPGILGHISSPAAPSPCRMTEAAGASSPGCGGAHAR